MVKTDIKRIGHLYKSPRHPSQNQPNCPLIHAKKLLGHDPRLFAGCSRVVAGPDFSEGLRKGDCFYQWL